MSRPVFRGSPEPEYSVERERERYRTVSWGDIGHARGCKECGVLVIDIALHDLFHRKLEARRA